MENISLKDVICGRLAKEKNLLVNSSYKLNEYDKIKNLFLLQYAESFFNDNNILDEVIKNIKENRYINAENLHDVILKHDLNIISILLCGFDWFETVQGSQFWSKLNRKYINFLTTIIIEKKL